MKKHLIAAAVAAAVAVPAAAQVTVYGVLDKSYGQLEVEGFGATANKTAKTDGIGHGALSSERLGFRGEEDLGGGLKAHFVYELGIGSAITGGTADARTQIVGLSGAFGRIDIGRDKTPSQLFAEAFTAGGANNTVGEGILYKGMASSASSSTVSTKNHLSNIGLERDEGFTYTSPNMNGFQVRAMLVQDDTENRASTVAGRDETNLKDIAIYYRGVKGLTVGVARGEVEVESGPTAETDLKDKATQIGASYAFGPATFFVQRFDAEGENASGEKDTTAEVNQYGVRYQAMPSLMVYAQMSSGEVGTTVKTHDTDSYQVGALYSLSKRTTAYLIMGEQENEIAATGVKTKNDGFAIGVRHSF
jgi:predicted porin